MRVLLTGEVLRWLLGRSPVPLHDRPPFRADPDAARDALESLSPMVLAAGDPRGLLPSAEWARGFRSIDGLRSALPANPSAPALAGAELQPGADWLLYDAEGWAFTPPAEREDPPTAFRSFCRLVGSVGGARSICAPALTLVEGLPAPSGRSGSPWERYLAAGWPAVVGAVADGYVIQAQRLQRLRRLDEFAAFVAAAAQQARSAAASGRTLLVLAGLSTAGSGEPPRLDDLLDATARTAGVVDGYWLNVPRRGPACPSCPEAPPVELAFTLLRELARLVRR